MTDPAVEVATAPPLVTVPNVELMHTGQWPISTGIAHFTASDLQNAVAALSCPAVRRPVLKLGHSEPDPDENGIRWDGEPAVGYIANMAVAANGQMLVGDYAGMPSWLGGEVLASAYPDRSIEGQYDFRCQIGHTHPFVITAVALLGVTPPGIGTLQSLQDVAALYGVTGAETVAAAAPGGGPSFTVTVHAARQEAAVPNPTPTTVRAGVTTDDVRRAFYDSENGKGWDIWICEIQLGPTTQLIVIDDSTGKLQRVPVTISDGDGEDAVEFGEPVAVVVRYEDAQVAASAERQTVVYASRDESRPGQSPAGGPPADAPETESGQGAATSDSTTSAASSRPEPQDPPEPVRAGGTTRKEGAAMDAAKLREALGLPSTASDDDVRAALTDQGVTPTQPTEPTQDPAGEPEGEPDDGDGDGGEDEPSEPGQQGEPTQQVTAKATSLPPGTVAIDETTLQQLRRDAQEGVAARAQQKREARDRALDDAIKAGKFPPARREHWATYWDRDEEGAKAAITDLAEGLVPVKDVGEPGGEPTETFDDIDRLFSVPVPKGA
ncbi:phage protease [Actinomadura luteofluorescens]|uniref:phage protease n=1 Tax=Actinomadura luteofluorescens TaxID=46163 RepID=UPI003D8AF7BC